MDFYFTFTQSANLAINSFLSVCYALLFSTSIRSLSNILAAEITWMRAHMQNNICKHQ